MVGFLSEPFLAAVDSVLRPELGSFSDLEQRLVAMVNAARAEWPNVVVAPDVFVAYVGARLATDRSAEEALAAAHPSDLYLACACACGDGAALAAFDRRFVTEIGGALARMRLSAASVDEIKQLVRQKLFVAVDGGVGKIADYSGRSGLKRWVRAVAVRTGLNFIRKGKREVLVEDDKVLAGVSSGDDDPEVVYMKQKYRHEFREAFQQALASVEDRQKSLLRYHYVDGLNIDEIGTIYRVHRVTAYRWLEKAREVLIQRTNVLLRDRLKVEEREYDSILRLIRSQLHVSLHRHLQDWEPQ